MLFTAVWFLIISFTNMNKNVNQQTQYQQITYIACYCTHIFITPPQERAVEEQERHGQRVGADRPRHRRR